jgi:hypothetical protein
MHAWPWASELLAAWLFPAGAREGGGVGVGSMHVTEEMRELRSNASSV